MAAYQFWDDSFVFPPIEDGSTAAITLGVVFKSSVAAQVTHIRAYIPDMSSVGGGSTLGTVTSVRLYAWGTNTLLGSATPGTQRVTPGWLTTALSSPVNINAETNYVAAAFYPNGRFGVQRSVSNVARVVGPLSTIPSGTTANGRFDNTGSAAYPETQGGSNPFYSVDLVLSTGKARRTSFAVG